MAAPRSSRDASAATRGRGAASASVANRLQAARRLCEARGAQWTPQREDVLRRLLEGGGTRKAYDLLAELQAERGKVAPTTLYRVLDFLVEHGLVHHVASSSAYVVCATPDHAHEPAVFVACGRCGAAREVPGGRPARSLLQALRAAGFHGHELEVRGHCTACIPTRSSARAHAGRTARDDGAPPRHPERGTPQRRRTAPRSS